MLSGDDPFASMIVSRSGLRRQCRRELSGLALQLRREYIRYCVRPSTLVEVMEQAVRTLLPLFKAVMLLYDRKVPNSKTELIAAAEDLFGLGASVLSEVYNRSKRIVAEKKVTSGFDELLRIVEIVAGRIGAMPESTEIPLHSGLESPFVPVDR